MTVRTSVTLPDEMKEWADENNISLSGVLQDALAERMNKDG
ncbi:MAG: hypothetical protein SVS85_02045 [Candidatus Nanohaloarchaea archaeon]|nr:hypothetical protein [Candidatus Nanohaloarchaea archaeon]